MISTSGSNRWWRRLQEILKDWRDETDNSELPVKYAVEYLCESPPSDPDYRDNDIQANRQWRSRHPSYWRTYRRQHPQSVIRNRDKQRERDRARRLKLPLRSTTPHLANEDASTTKSH